MKHFLYILIASLFIIFSACNGNSDSNNDTESNDTTLIEEVQVENTNQVSEEELVQFITAPDFGWKKSDEMYFLAFFPDGRLSIQGDGGEETMSEGTWEVSGSQVTLHFTDEGTTENYKARIDGQNLFLGDTKYEPEL